ncbi:MAG: hypothetical protein LBD46_00510 [Endomicrobium sp.]|jgi:hypothetical protein|nr:hypothetical protein [Endomicrobium sp.]
MQQPYNEASMLYRLEKRYCSFDGYVINKNELYICLNYDAGNGHSKTLILKYRDRHLMELTLKEQEINSLLENIIPVRDAEDYDNFDNKIIINDKKYINLIPLRTEEERQELLARGLDIISADKIFELAEGSKRRVLSKNYIAIMARTYFYVDNVNEKIYFYGTHFVGNLKGRTSDEVEKDTIGIYVCDLKTGKFYEIMTEKKNNPQRKTFMDPIRIPDTPYLLYHTYSLGGEWANSSKLAVNRVHGTEFWIQEIPEWK